MSEAMVSHIGNNPREQSSANEKTVEGIIEDTEGASNHQQDLPNCESLKKEIQNLKQLSLEACIFKVHEGLRRTKPEAYMPLLISIGPYHHGDSKLSKMEKLKLMYLKSFLQRGKGLIMEQCWKKLNDLKGRAESYYADDIKLSDNEFVKMLLLDGCFIVEFVVREYPLNDKGKEEECDTVFMPSGMKFQVLRDLLLLENQLPFFVLQELYDMIYHGGVTFLDKVKWTFVSMLTKIRLIPLNYIEDNDQVIKHLLQVVHILCDPQNIVTQQERDWTCFPCIFWKQSQDSNNESDNIRTASELQEAGVHLKKVDKSTSLFHIKFNHGELEIPSFHISDPTETFFRNIIAYEQHSCDVHPKYFTDYAQFMDNLINTEKDVILFRMNGVFINWLGDDKEVTDLFNRLCKGVVYSSCDDFYYTGVCNKLNQHYNKPWNVLMAKLRHDYFHTPWAGISTVAAILLLSLTIAQTVIAVLDLRK